MTSDTDDPNSNKIDDVANNTHNSITSCNDQSMEELKIDENEEKESSLEEDLLGAQSLLMSDSDDEETNNEKSPEIFKRSINKEAPETPIDLLEEEPNTATDSESAITAEMPNGNLIQPSADSSDDEDNIGVKQHKSRIRLSDSEDDTAAVDVGKKKISNLIDTDSEREEATVPTKTFKKSIDSDSDSEDNLESNKRKKSKKIKSNKSPGSDNESDVDHKNKFKKKISKIIDTDDEDIGKSVQSGSENEERQSGVQSDDGEQQSNQEEQQRVKNSKKIMRASAKKALDEMQAIQSEQQRLHREAHISIPYHKPKKHTLEEFLKRRTIIKPALDTNDNSSTLATKIKSKSLKMTTEELEEYAKLMEERAKEATEFFKSESEEEEEVLKDNLGVLDEPIAVQCTTIEAKEEGVISKEFNADIKQNNDEAQTEEEKQKLANKTDENDQVHEETMKADVDLSPVKAIITEVIQLPTLDLSTVQITIDSDNIPTTSRHAAEALAQRSSSSNAQEVTPNRVSPLISPKSAALTPRTQIANIKKMLAEQKAHESPTIRGDKNMLIDLDSGELVAKTPTGVDNLLERLMATKKARKERHSDTINILSTENGKLEMSKVQLAHHDYNEVKPEPKPGAAYLKLKHDLKSIITKKRLEDIQRKKAEEDEHNKLLNDGDDEDDVEEAMDMDEEYEPETKPAKAMDILIDEEENAIELDEYKEEEDDDNDLLDEDEENEAKDVEEAEINNEENEGESEEDLKLVEDEESMESNETDVEENDENALEKDKRKNRIIKAFQDDSDDEDIDDVDLLKTQRMAPPQTETSESTARQPGQGVLFEREAEKSALDEEIELLGLCSGKFGMTQQEAAPPLISQMQDTPITATDNENALIALCSGSFDSTQIAATGKQQTQLATKGNKILSSDEEPEESAAKQQREDITKDRIKKLTKRMKKRKTKLGFSDDEDDSEGGEEQADDADEIVDLLDEDDQPEAFVDYDSEENEIIVKMTKKERRLRAQNFMEKEAELSESEWGSADEDERNMDKYDIELGDEDEFDGEKLRNELGQIHARKMLDEDAKEVRKLQEMFFEDEERDGVGRQRQFRWKNAESGFSLEDGRQQDENNPHAESGDEENEHLWRKIRYEREQLLKEQMQKENLSTTSISVNSVTLNTTVVNGITLGTTKKLNIITAKQSATTTKDAKKVSSPFLISKSVTNLHAKTARGSFLVRDKDTLNKLAGLTKSKTIKNGAGGQDGDDTEAAGTVSAKPTSSKNFVFATLTVEEHETLKRKADDLMNSSNEHGVNYMKKPKTEPRRDKCLIDQLL